MHRGKDTSTAKHFGSCSWSWRNHRLPWRKSFFYKISTNEIQVPDVKAQKNLEYIQLKSSLYSTNALENTDKNIKNYFEDCSAGEKPHDFLGYFFFPKYFLHVEKDIGLLYCILKILT